MNANALAKQIEAALIANDAARASLEAALSLLAPEEPPPCDHPVDLRRVMSGMGHEHWVCGRCGFEYEQKAGD
jgi:hypothetical protein